MKGFSVRELNPFRYHRGAFIGHIAAVIMEEAAEIGLPINNRGRVIRLELTSELLEREVNSYNELTDTEVWSVQQWALANREQVRQWLAKTYGYQEVMF